MQPAVILTLAEMVRLWVNVAGRLDDVLRRERGIGIPTGESTSVLWLGGVIELETAIVASRAVLFELTE